MKFKQHLSRRTVIKSTLAGCSSVVAGAVLPGKPCRRQNEPTAKADPKIRGPFPILSTPFTESGEVDHNVLANKPGSLPGVVALECLASIGR